MGIKALNWLFCLLCAGSCCLPATLWAQYRIEGQATDAQTGEPVPAAMVSLLPQQGEQPLAYTLTDQEGRFAFSYAGEVRVLRLLIRHLSYREYTQLLVLAEENTAPVVIRAALQPQEFELDEVVVQEAPPIIVKQDTVIYDVEHWQQAGDQTLEDVLRKMPGFVVLPNGDIQYNGKTIQKVLVDGKEVSNVGAAAVTRSLDPARVESVEVRTNEKNQKLKNSLLDRNELLVLDVKLKGGMNNSFFGRVGAEVSGQEEEIAGGGYVNLLRLTDKSAAQLIAEQEPLGITEISIYDLRSIGTDALAELFSLPADFEELKRREAYAGVLYGFHDYLRNPNTIAGVSTKWQVSPHAELTMASFNQYNELTTQSNTRWDFAGNNASNEWRNEVFQLDFQNKSKLLWAFDTEKSKSRVALNLDYRHVRPNTSNQENTSGLYYDFRSRQQRMALLPTVFYEHLLNERWAIQFKGGYVYRLQDLDNRLLHNDSSYATYWQDDNGNFINYFRQSRRYLQHALKNAVLLQYTTASFGDFRLGGAWDFNYMAADKKASYYAAENWRPLSSSAFEGNIEDLQSYLIKPFFTHNLQAGSFLLSHTWAWAHQWYPSLPGNRMRVKSRLEYEVQLTASLASWSINTSFSSRLLDFPLVALTPGDELEDFRSIVRTRLLSLEPQLGQVFSFSASKSWIGNWDFVLAVARGKTRNAPLFRVQNVPFIEQLYAQQLADYWMSELQLTKNFLDPALKIGFVQSFLQNGQENINGVDSTTYRSDAVRWMTELNVSYGGMRSRWKLTWNNKLSNYAFRNELIEGVPVQRMFSSSVGVDYELILERLLASINGRHVYFYDAQSATFWELNAGLKYVTPLWQVDLSAGNLLNNREFVMQDVSPLLINTNYRRVLPRYVKVGVRRTF